MLLANYYQQDRVNNASFEEIDRHHTYNPTFTNRLLRSEFLKRGIELNNPDVNQGKEVAFSILHDGQDVDQIPAPKYLIATENPYICPLNNDRRYLNSFNGVFTWNINLLHLPNVTHIFVPNQIQKRVTPSFKERPIFSCIINANKAFPVEVDGDLYKERIKVIRWYEKNAPQYFLLYGLGWNKPEPAFSFSKKITRRMKRLATQAFGYNPFPSYAGEVADKGSIYQHAKFAYCYENVANLPDYITEKIYDCFFNGCIPIYWGANTINKHIPNDCFIDRRDFKSTEETHKFLLGIDQAKYQKYQDSIQEFLTSPKAMEFDTSKYVAKIIDKICNDLIWQPDKQ
jgi:hypothetical protein